MAKLKLFEGLLQHFQKRFPKLWKEFEKVEDMKELNGLRKDCRKRIAAGDKSLVDGAVDAFYSEVKKGVKPMVQKSAAERRAERVLRTRISTGKAKARKWA